MEICINLYGCTARQASVAGFLQFAELGNHSLLFRGGRAITAFDHGGSTALDMRNGRDGHEARAEQGLEEHVRGLNAAKDQIDKMPRCNLMQKTDGGGSDAEIEKTRAG